jgi:hypothetical protein
LVSGLEGIREGYGEQAGTGCRVGLLVGTLGTWGERIGRIGRIAKIVRIGEWGIGNRERGKEGNRGGIV